MHYLAPIQVSSLEYSFQGDSLICWPRPLLSRMEEHIAVDIVGLHLGQAALGRQGEQRILGTIKIVMLAFIQVTRQR